MRAIDRPLLALVGTIEAPRGYGSVTGFANEYTGHPVTQMTIAEVMEWQRKIRSKGVKSTAVGRFQFTLATLDDVTDRFDVSRDRPLNRRTQDYLARLLLYMCDFYAPDATTEDVGNCLAGRWAALPMLSGPKKGTSRYKGVAKNRARTSVTVFRAVLAARFLPDSVRVTGATVKSAGREMEKMTSSPDAASPVSVSQSSYGLLD